MDAYASVDACPVVQPGRLSYLFNDAVPEVSVETAAFSWRDGETGGSVWIATYDNKLSVLSVNGATDPPGPVAKRIAEALAADLLAE